MANERNYNYQILDRPYNTFMERSSETGAFDQAAESLIGSPQDGVGGAMQEDQSTIISSPNQVLPSALSGSSLTDTWIETWIKSRSYLPKSAGFYIDGRTGYIECRDLFSNNAEITGVITANTGRIGGDTGWVIQSNTLTDVAGLTGLSNVVTAGDDIRFWAGNVDPTIAPFRVYESGAIYASSATISGSITATTGYIGGWVVGATDLKDTAGLVGMSSAVTGGDDVRFWAGNTTPASAPFYVTESGFLAASSGTVGGNTLGTNFMSSSTFVSGPLGSGWRIMSTGVAEFQDVTVRGIIRTSVFEKGTISAVNGMLLVSKADALASAMTALDSSTLTITGATTFAVDEVIRIKDGTNDEWMLVTNIASAPTYTVTRDLAGSYAPNVNPAWTKGTAVVSMGVGSGSKTGYILLDSSSTDSPFIDVYARNSTTYTDTSLKARIGWLHGIVDSDVGLSSTDVWGLYSSNVYLKGAIVANTGYIGGASGWVISSNTIKDVAGLVGLSNAVTAGDDIRFWAGNVTPASAPFRVTESGVLFASSGTVGGWTLGSSSFTGTGVTISSSGDASIAFGTTPPTGPATGTGIYMDKTGIFGLSANTQNFKILASDGSIVAIKGTIAAFTIAGTSLSATNLSLNSGAANTANITVGTGSNAGGLNSANSSSDIIFWGGSSFANRATAAFRVTAAGALTATSATITGDITANTGKIGGSSGWVITSNNIKDVAGLVGLSNTVTAGDDIRFWAGNTTPASAPFYVTESGVIQASSGTVGGNTLGSNFMSSTTFVSGLLGSGWRIQSSGIAEFQDVTVRGVIRTSVFEKGTISAVNGMVLISKADILAADMTALDSSTVTIGGATTFVANEVIRIKDGTNDEWMLVTNAASAPTYTVTRDLAAAYPANTNPIWTKGTAVVSMGVGTGSKTGYILLDSSSTDSPFIDIYARNSNTYSDTTLKVRLGWLHGIVDSDVGLSSTDTWGLYSTNAYLKGAIVANSGYIGGNTGWVISTNTIKDVAGLVGLSNVVTGGDDIRFWAGHVTPASAPFYVTESGALVATSATISGSVTATTGAIGGWTIGSTTLSNGTDIVLDSANKKISIKNSTFGSAGVQMDYSGGSGRLYVGDGADQFFKFDGTTGTANNSTLVFQDCFGDGSDGNATISGDTTLTTDMYYNNLTVNTGVTLHSGSWRIFVKDTLTTNGTGKISNAGNPGGNGGNGPAFGNSGSNAGGTPGSTGATVSAGFFNAGVASGTAGYGTDANGASAGSPANGTNNTTLCMGVSGVAGVGGGNGADPSGGSAAPAGGTYGAGGTAGTATAVSNHIRSLTELVLFRDFTTSTPGKLNNSAGSGGASGGGNARTSGIATFRGAGGGGGGTGSHGGTLFIAAAKIINNGTITAGGGAGGNGGKGGSPLGTGSGGPANGGGGGGGGGGTGGSGGVMILVYKSLTNNGTITVAGGAGGTGGAGGDPNGTGFAGATGPTGTTGNVGTLIQLPV